MKLRLLALAATLGVAAMGHALWAVFEKDTPVDQILPNVEQQVRLRPRDAAARYVLGRVHSLAFASGRKTVTVIPPEQRRRAGGSLFASYSSIRVPLDENAPMTAARRRHLRRSIDAYSQAIRLDPKNPLYHLGLGWMQENAAKVGELKSARPALETYRQVIRLRADEERKMEVYGLSPDDQLAREAALGIVRILKSGLEAKRMQALADELAKKPTPITPIVIPLNGERTLAELLDPTRRVGFNLAGDGVKRSWPWVRPATGILVWDPRDTGQITSGRQLFGSATWWMFFPDGYAALATLDTNHDGWLTGQECAGVRVWQDQNGNGRSDPGEVRHLAHYGIAALRAKASQQGPQGPWAEVGVRRADGTTTASYDWVPVGK